MFEGLHDIDWSAMHHAYGSAEEVPALLTALRSADAPVRDKARARFYGAVHHQGDVYRSTTASLPFLFELAGDPATPDRPAIVAMLVSIGTTSVERCGIEFDEESAEFVDYAAAARVLRGRAEVFVGLASDADGLVRRAAIPGLGLFIDDGARAVAVLRGRLTAESGVVERLLIVEAMAAMALRLPAWLPAAVSWFAGLAADPGAGPPTRLAAVVARARCEPERIGDDVVPAAIDLLRQITPAPPAEWATEDRSRRAPLGEGQVPPEIIFAFEDMYRQQLVHAPTTDLLRTFHRVLGARVAQRTMLLAEQLRDRDPGSRLDAIRMSGQLMKEWRGDHTPLVNLVAGQLDGPSLEIVAEAAAVLEACHPIAGSAREPLAMCVASQHASHGPQIWTTPQPKLRRAHQEAVTALARLGDPRAVPSLLVALDSGVDAWRAVKVAGAVPDAAADLVPRLCDRLSRVDLTQDSVDSSVGAIVSALSALRDPAAVPVIADTLTGAMRHERVEVAVSALGALRAFGTAAEPTLVTVRSLTTASGTRIRSAVVAALWAIGRDHEEVMPLLRDMIEDPVTVQSTGAVDVLGEIGRPAAATLPRLRHLLADDYEWIRVPCAAACWDIGGEPEATRVLEVLLAAWARNPATGNHVVACLDRMGAAAEPAVPQIRENLARPGRGGRFASIANDEKMQRTSRAIVDRFA